MKFYLAGPMRGYPRMNFDSFDAARQFLEHTGQEVVSPADLDRELGFHPDVHDETFFKHSDVVARDLEALQQCDGIMLLPGWKQSLGARAEASVAIWLGLVVLEFESFYDHVAGTSTHTRRLRRIRFWFRVLWARAMWWIRKTKGTK